MKSIEENELLNNLCIEFNIKLSPNLKNRKIYEEIETFKDYEYIYCIAYEMLIRTDEYNSLLKKYDDLMDIAIKIPKNEEVVKLDNLITQMNQLGLNQNSFIGFDCGDGNVFEKIKLYEEITNSPWSVRTLDKFILNSTDEYENILDMLIDFYYKKKELYKIEDGKAKVKKYIKTDMHPRAIFGVDNNVFIPCINQNSKQTVYKSLSDVLYLKELDKEFLSSIKEKKKNNLLKQIKLDYKVATSF
jgi:hypothetical protein